MKRSKILITILCFSMITALFPSCKDIAQTSECHSFDVSEVTVEPSCTEGGEIIRKCSICGEGKKYRTAPSSHVLTDWKDNGRGEYVKTCTLCDKEIAREKIYTTYSENLEYERGPRDNHFTLVGIGSCTDSVVVIPPEVGGIPVTSIAGKAFQECKNIDAVIIPSTITEIEYCTFLKSSVKRVFIPDGVTSIEGSAFAYCRELSELILPNSLTSLGGSVFANTTKLSEIIIPPSLKHLQRYTFTKSSIASISLPEGIESIGESAFNNCFDLKKVYLPNTLTEIGIKAFKYCSDLEEIYLPDSLTKIDTEAFAGCIFLTDVLLPEGITYLGPNCFSECISLSTVNIPKGISSLQKGVFSNCRALKKVYFNSNLEMIQGDTFFGIDLADVEIFIPESNKNFYLIGSSLIGRSHGTILIGAADGSIPSDKRITRIGPAAFRDRLDLEHIVIPKNITHISGGAFYGCEHLISITYEGTVAEWEEIYLGKEWYDGSRVKSVKCADGEVEIRN